MTHMAKSRRAAVGKMVRELRTSLLAGLDADDRRDDYAPPVVHAPVDRTAALARALDLLLPAARADAWQSYLRRAKS